jgi:UDP-2,3-diacylglucosamine pyrophosphatase LpxH
VAGKDVNFEIGQDWVERYAGKLQIGHGHMSDVANRFVNWQRPIVTGPYGIECLEMCPGTLFMVKFVNKLEAQYPFADNLLPVTRLAWVLLGDDKSGFASVGWMFTRLIATTSWAVLGTGKDDGIGARLLASVQGSRSRAARLDAILAELGMNRERQWLAARSLDQEQLAALMFALLGRIDEAVWKELFELGKTGVALGTDEVTLSALRQAGKVDGKQELRDVARRRARLKEASVVVMGHTHQEDQLDLDGGATYFNPGCWTRYLELEAGRQVTLEDLKDESKYPYALNVVRIESNSGALAARMQSIDRYPPSS